jgi:S-methylmethionine-dependent homocysteine/selenocysteine methylase
MSEPRPFILDGGLATELQRHGVPVRAPWWAGRALLDPQGRELLTRIHARYVAAGAGVLTADTFRGNLRAAGRTGISTAEAAALIGVAVDVARRGVRRAAGGREIRVAASMAPVEDCYRPELVPPDRTLVREHRWMAAQLAAAGVDLVLAETMNTTREAVAATEAATESGLPVWVSFVCADDGRLLGGEDVGAAARAVIAAGAGAVLVNCTGTAGTGRALRRLREATSGPIGAYPNVEDRSGLPPATPVDRHLPAAVDPAGFAEQGVRWWSGLGVTLLGGCCGTTPEHIAALRSALEVASADGTVRESEPVQLRRHPGP